MKVVVVYESMFGNTHAIADAIAKGIADDNDVVVVPVGRAGPDLIGDSDLVIAGGPTHVHGMSRASTRQGAVEKARKPGAGLTLEAGADGPGLREWFESLGHASVAAAAFDTRVGGPVALTGRASVGISRQLRLERGFRSSRSLGAFSSPRLTSCSPASKSTHVSGERTRYRASSRPHAGRTRELERPVTK